MHEQAAATGWKQCKLPLSHSGSTQIQSGGDAATPSQHLLSRRPDATVFSPRETARTTTSICTRPGLKQSPHCASQTLHDATGSKQCKLPYQRSTITQIPSGGSQLTSPQSQVGCNRSSHAMATCGTVEHNNINLHTTQTEATTALRVTIIT